MLNLLHELYADGKLSAASYEGYRQRIINSALGRKKRKKPQCKWCNQYMEGHIDDLCPRGKFVFSSINQKLQNIYFCF